jgi:hypothetical protein
MKRITIENQIKSMLIIMTLIAISFACASMKVFAGDIVDGEYIRAGTIKGDDAKLAIYVYKDGYEQTDIENYLDFTNSSNVTFKKHNPIPSVNNIYALRTHREALNNSSLVINLKANGNKFKTITKLFPANEDRLLYLQIAQRAVERGPFNERNQIEHTEYRDKYGDNDYNKDMDSIWAFVNNFSYLNASTYDGITFNGGLQCGSGAKIMQTWSSYKYDLPGDIISPNPKNTSHMAFCPDLNNMDVYYDCQGHLD